MTIHRPLTQLICDILEKRTLATEELAKLLNKKKIPVRRALANLRCSGMVRTERRDTHSKDYLWIFVQRPPSGTRPKGAVAAVVAPVASKSKLRSYRPDVIFRPRKPLSAFEATLRANMR